MRWLGVDVGGTFTDLVLLDDETDEIRLAKRPSRSTSCSHFSVFGLKPSRCGDNSEPEPEAYLSNFQDPWRYMTLVVRTKSASPIIGAVRNEILAVDKDQPVYNVRSMEELLSESVAQPRFSLSLLSLFAAMAMALLHRLSRALGKELRSKLFT